VAEWQPYANGLKALAQKFFGTKIDAGVTGDCARVLRVPGTLNFKYTPPAAVRLLGLKDTDYDFARDLAVLPTMSPVASMAVANRFFDPALFRPGALPPEFASLPLDSVGAGIEKREAPPVDVFAAAKECGWLKEALVTGGKDFGQGLWNLSVLTAVFLEDGHELAHKMSKGHPEYNYDETEALWERKSAERRDRGLGWPSCAAIQSEGCTHCAACKRLAKGKSPLNLAKAEVRATPSKGIVHTGESNGNPAVGLMSLRDGGADLSTILLSMNESFAVVKYGGQILVACISNRGIDFMKVEDFRKMFANCVIHVEVGNSKKTIRVSERWFEWKDRRQFTGRGVVFEPGGPLEIPNDMLNLWRGFDITPEPGIWSLMRGHILKVVCSGDQTLFDYLIQWMAYRVQHPDRPIGVAVALHGAQGAGKGIVARTFGSFFGKHFAHITHGDQLSLVIRGWTGWTIVTISGVPATVRRCRRLLEG
jgi:hypothetical protein